MTDWRALKNLVLREESSLHQFFSSVSAEPVLWRLKNPHGCFWQGEEAELSPVVTLSKIPVHRRILLFIHGAEYRDEQEVIRDLVEPFERQAQVFRNSHASSEFDLYFVSWNSALIDERSNHPLSTWRNRVGLPVFALLGWRYWSAIYKGLERRADQTGRFITAFCDHLVKNGASDRLYTVTHSLGARVWSQALRRTSLERGAIYPGYWLNMQPAIEYDAFKPGKDFENVWALYKNSQARQAIWYSRFDMILSSIYFFVKRTTAMGTIGGDHKGIAHLNVTDLVGEAHGQVRLFPKQHCFFRRAGKHIRNEMTRYVLGAEEQVKEGPACHLSAV